MGILVLLNIAVVGFNVFVLVVAAGQLESYITIFYALEALVALAVLIGLLMRKVRCNALLVNVGLFIAHAAYYVIMAFAIWTINIFLALFALAGLLGAGLSWWCVKDLRQQEQAAAAGAMDVGATKELEKSLV